MQQWIVQEEFYAAGRNYPEGANVHDVHPRPRRQFLKRMERRNFIKLVDVPDPVPEEIKKPDPEPIIEKEIEELDLEEMIEAKNTIDPADIVKAPNKRGRPKGSVNKKKGPRKKRGRPRKKKSSG